MSKKASGGFTDTGGGSGVVGNSGVLGLGFNATLAATAGGGGQRAGSESQPHSPPTVMATRHGKRGRDGSSSGKAQEKGTSLAQLGHHEVKTVGGSIADNGRVPGRHNLRATDEEGEEYGDGGIFSNGNAAAQQAGTPAVSALPNPAAQLVVASKEGTLSVAFDNSQPQKAQGSRSPSISMPPPGNKVPFTKPTTRFGWHMGPEQVPFVFGPFITKTEGLLMALLSAESELDVALYVAMMRLVAEYTPPDRRVIGASASEEEEETFLRNQVAKFQQAQGGTKPELIYEDLLLVNRFFTRRTPQWGHSRTGYPEVDARCSDVSSLLSVLGGLAVQPKGQTRPILFPQGDLLPIEYLVAMGRLVEYARFHATGEVRNLVMTQLPVLQLARRCLVELQREKPSLRDRALHTPAWGVEVETVARLQLLSLLLATRVSIVTELLADEEGTKKIIALLEDPNAMVVEAAIFALTKFTTAQWYGDTSKVGTLLLKCNVMRPLKMLLDQPSKKRNLETKADALRTLFNIARDHGAEVVEAGMDEVGITLMAAEEPARIRTQAMSLVENLVARKHLNSALLFRVIQKISSFMQLDLETHCIFLYHLLKTVLRNLIQVKAQQPQLFADCVEVLKDPASLAAYKRHDAKIEEVLPWVKSFYQDHVEV